MVTKMSRLGLALIQANGATGLNTQVHVNGANRRVSIADYAKHSLGHSDVFFCLRVDEAKVDIKPGAVGDGGLGGTVVVGIGGS